MMVIVIKNKNSLFFFNKMMLLGIPYSSCFKKDAAERRVQERVL